MAVAGLKRILTVLNEALALPEDERENYLNQIYREDTLLGKEVEKLLESEEQSQNFWEEWKNWNQQQLLDLFRDYGTEEPPEEQIGPWKLKELIAEGGMGSVWLADRADGSYQQEVALKIMHKSYGRLSNSTAIFRFEQERQILAQLNHPNIARLYDGGITDDGRPWLALEYIDGQPITEWCNHHNYSVEQRLQLFEKVCEAIQYAHKNLIVHRDLKPDNILVTASGEVKILDFGIAKLLDDASSPVHTQTGIRAMSLNYAAPEQITGEPVTTATDVHALGLLLYELLAGCFPFDFKDLNLRKIERLLSEEDPAKPSFNPRRDETIPNCQEIRGDLDAIVLKALRKEPSQRYENAGHFLSDIHRYRKKVPVFARRDTFRYRAGKFLSRHRNKLSVGLVILIGIASLISYYTWQLTQQRNIAQNEAEKSEEILGFMLGMFEAGDPRTNPGETITARELLERGTEDARLLDNQPEVQAEMFRIIGKVYTSLGEYERAENILNQALSIKRETSGSEPAALASSLNDLAVAVTRQGRYDEARAFHNEALDIQRNHFGENHPQVANTLQLMTSRHQVVGFDNVAELRKKVLDIRLQNFDNDHLKVASSWMDLGKIKRSSAQPTEAIRAYQKAKQIRKQQLGPEHPEVAESMIFLADTYRLYEIDLEQAEKLYNDALNILQNSYEDYHPSLLHGLGSLATLLSNKGDHDRAEELRRKSLNIRYDVFGADHPTVAEGLSHLAGEFQNRGKFEEAREYYQKSLDLWKEIYDDDHINIGGAKKNLGSAMIDLRNYDKADSLLTDALKIVRNKFGEKAGQLIIGERARMMAHKGNFDKAEELYKKAISRYNDDGEEPHYDLRRLQEELEEVHRLREDHNHRDSSGSIIVTDR